MFNKVLLCSVKYPHPPQLFFSLTATSPPLQLSLQLTSPLLLSTPVHFTWSLHLVFQSPPFPSSPPLWLIYFLNEGWQWAGDVLSANHWQSCSVASLVYTHTHNGMSWKGREVKRRQGEWSVCMSSPLHPQLHYNLTSDKLSATSKQSLSRIELRLHTHTHTQLHLMVSVFSFLSNWILFQFKMHI